MAITLVLPGLCAGQGFSVSPSVLTNKDVIILAGAGFSEGFILDTIAGRQGQYDTTSNGLADLAKHAISERIIRAMMEQASRPEPMVAGTVAASGDAPIPVVMPSPEVGALKSRSRMVKPTPVSLALSSGTPFYEWKSVFWGLWRKRVGVAPSPVAYQQIPTQHLGNLYRQVRPAPPQGQQYVRVSTHGGYPFEPMTYFLVAPK